MRIGVVYPGISGCGFNSLGKSDTLPVESNWISHGVASIATILKKEGHDVRVFDLRTMGNLKEFKNEVKEFKPSVMCISVTSADVPMVLKLVEVTRKINRNIINIVGGLHPTLEPVDFVHQQKINFVFAGEAERSLPRLLKEVESGVKGDGQVIHGLPANLDDLPFIGREFFKYHGELNNPPHPVLNTPFVTIMAGRGCNRGCVFCQPALQAVHGKARKRSPGHVVEEISFLEKRYNFKSFIFHDPDLLNDPSWMEEFHELYLDKVSIKKFFIHIRPDTVVKQKRLLESFSKIGLNGVIMGLESGCQRVLNCLRTGTTTEQNREAVAVIKNLGLILCVRVMLGSPAESREEVDLTVDTIADAQPHMIIPSFFIPLPGTYLYRNFKNSNLVFAKDCKYRIVPEQENIRGIDYDYLNNVLDQWKQESDYNDSHVYRFNLVKPKTIVMNNINEKGGPGSNKSMENQG